MTDDPRVPQEGGDPYDEYEYDEYEYDEYDDEEDEASSRNRARIALASILALLLLLLVALLVFVFRLVTPPGTPTDSDDVPEGVQWVRSIYGYGPNESQQFFRPIDAAVAPNGIIWGTDSQRARLLGFAPDGTLDGVVHTGPRGTGKGRLGMPEGIGTDQDGNIYVTDTDNQKVMVFGADGRFRREWSVPMPGEVAVRNGRIVVGSVPGLSVFDDTGKLLAVIGKRGQGPDDFETAHGIAIADDGTIYVADTNNARIKAYRQDGRLKWVWPANRTRARKPGAAPTGSTGPLRLPASLTLDGRGRIVVMDAFNFQIVVLEPKEKGAEQVGRYGKPGTADGYFAYPTGIDYDATRDYFVIADTNNDRLQVVRIPDSADPGLIATARRLFANWWAWCCPPLLLILLALALALWRRRAREQAARQNEQSQAQDGAEDADSLDEGGSGDAGEETGDDEGA